ncbi:sensor histidine kinase [Trebonia kvetii]|uniref:sensor histidine kinase n=1 Tax=Trebonia kvetii TaxID=2480626 RepID=UPI0016522755|nr:HAMP domain-containing sensor histidine kinase [Trebonia kvetii]
MNRAGTAVRRVRLPRALREPSLRRRVAVSFAVLAVAETIVLAGIVETIDNVLISPGIYPCGGFSFPAVPSTSGCAYSVPVRLVSLAGAAVVLVLLGWIWWLVAGLVLQPLTATADTVRRLGPQNLGQRIRLISGPDQYKGLTDAIDDALDRLAAGYESQRRFAANASHELRTPLAVQRLLTEVAMEDPDSGQDLRRLGAQLLRTNERNENLIEGLLALAESDRGVQGKIPVRLDDLARGVLETHQELAASQQVSLRSKLDEITVPCDLVLIERLLANLVSNAISYNEPGGWVEVEVTAEAWQEPLIRVRNTGPHVPAESVPTLFEPFKRLGADRVRTGGRGGVGLGLAIVRSIVLAHQGTVAARPRPGGGLEIEVTLPAARPARPQAPGQVRPGQPGPG